MAGGHQWMQPATVAPTFNFCWYGNDTIRPLINEVKRIIHTVRERYAIAFGTIVRFESLGHKIGLLPNAQMPKAQLYDSRKEPSAAKPVRVGEKYSRLCHPQHLPDSLVGMFNMMKHTKLAHGIKTSVRKRQLQGATQDKPFFGHAFFFCFLQQRFNRVNPNNIEAF